MSEVSFVSSTPKWITMASHRNWMSQQADSLFSFFENNSINPQGGFFNLDDEGQELRDCISPNGSQVRELFRTARMVHCFACGYLLGRPGSDVIVDHGMQFLWNRHRDAKNGGYFWGVDDEGPTDSIKQAYGHAFVLLAAASAKVAGHPDADRLLADVSAVIEERFWDREYGASAEQFTADWQTIDGYRGQNCNMHLTEALMAAFEATENETYLRMAESIADLIIRRKTEPNGWRLPEHYTEHWETDKAYSGSPIFRPHGMMPGHSIEWSRLLLQLWVLDGGRLAWLRNAANKLFRQATSDGWDHENGGFYSTLDWDGQPLNRNRYWWPCCEGIGAAAYLNEIEGETAGAFYENWYRRIWNFSAVHFIDRNRGGWFPQLGENLKPGSNPFFGKPDIYHALQACLIPQFPKTGSITRAIMAGSSATGKL